MTESESKLEDWLELANTRNLKEEEYEKLLEWLPEDTDERNRWLDELRVSQSLNETQKDYSQWLNIVKSKIDIKEKRIKNKYKRYQFSGVAALLMISFASYVFIASESTNEKGLPKIKKLPLVGKLFNKEPANSEDTSAEISIANSDGKKPVDSAVIFEIPSLEDTNVNKVIGKLANVSYDSVVSNAKSGTPGKGGGKMGGWPEGLEAVKSGEKYHQEVENKFILTEKDQKSTFSIDVDTASYANIRRMINYNQIPNPDAVRVEEMINYFDYAYPQPIKKEPFSVIMEMEQCPWNMKNKILKIGLKGKMEENRPSVNLVFLLDVSGSMSSADKLPLLKNSFSLLLNNLKETDTVAIVAYAGQTGVVLEPTAANEKHKIMGAIRRLRSAGSTNGVGGIQLAYQLAQKKFLKKGVNRVILATDGDFNVGISDRNHLNNFIAEKRKTGVELSVLGFGTGNIRDDIMESLANKGNGNYSYIDSIREARKALVTEMSGTLVTIAKDVKIQMEFNPKAVQSFRLIGYENRRLAHKDFNDDKKDAGEIGMGHTVTALYEIVPRENFENLDEVLKLNLRYKKPGTENSLLLSYSKDPSNLVKMKNDFYWALSVSAFGQKLRNSEYMKTMPYSDILKLAKSSKGDDKNGYRAEMIQLLQQHMDQLNLKKESGSELPKWQYR